MRIECPGCEAAYEVPEAQIRPGRSVRCARCGLQWRPGGEAEQAGLPEPAPAAADPEDASEPAAAASADASEDGLPDVAPPGHAPGHPLGLRRAATPEPVLATAVAGTRRPSPELAAWGAAWAVSLIVLAGLLLSAAHWRETVMRSWPPSIRLYTALGALPPG